MTAETMNTATAEATVDSAHQPEPWYWEAGSDECPHGDKPSDASTDAEYDAWHDRHRLGDAGYVCLDAPMGDCCPECSADHNEPVSWANCEVRKHIRPKPGITPILDAHDPIEVWVGTGECLERECEDYFTDDGDEIPGKDRCSHIGVELICGGCSTRTADGYYEPTVPWTGPHPAPAPSAA